MNPVSTSQVLREEVSWVFLSLDFAQFDRSISHALLNPQALRVHVPELAEPLSAADAYRGGTIRPHADRQVQAHVPKESLVPKANTTGLYDSIKLRLT